MSKVNKPIHISNEHGNKTRTAGKQQTGEPTTSCYFDSVTTGIAWPLF